ncbi:hypothetical protein LCGC14_1372090 [marine sediment metagenome]|uniref:Uncharacterized protein n=1 Tax=marine sediment metagenome TaxID=412755 RepID=A0A0F9K5D2_9ZZZZ
MNDHIVMETGEQVPAPDRYERFGDHYAPIWEFGPGEICPQTGEVIPEGGFATVMCCGDVRPVKQLTWWERRKAARLYAEAGL